MRRKKAGKASRQAKAKKAASVVEQEQDYSRAPHSFVFHRGNVGKPVKELVQDMRKIMEPYTAAKLKISKKNVMKDFQTIAGTLHVSHFMVFTKTALATYLKLICVPKGPTLTFKINEYCLSRDVMSAQKHPDLDTKLFSNHAVMVTNIPTESMENRLINVTFKNMFPSINPNTVSLNKMRRCVLINYDPATKSVDMRHYTMKVVPTGLSRGMKKLMKSKLPNLGGRQDISELFLDKGLSDSEGEQDGPDNQVVVPQKVKDRGVKANSTNAIRLKEIGPRLNMSLVKIEEGFEAGDVLYHAFIEKTPEELELTRQARIEKQKLKMARRQKQEADIRRKGEAKVEHIKKTKEGMERKRKADKPDEEEGAEDGPDDGPEVEDDDDVAYYRQEVGEDPDPEIISQMKRKTSSKFSGPKVKRARTDFKKGPGEKRDFSKSPGKKFDFKMKGGDDRRFKKGGDDRGFKKGGNDRRFNKGGDDRRFNKGGDDKRFRSKSPGKNKDFNNKRDQSKSPGKSHKFSAKFSTGKASMKGKVFKSGKAKPFSKKR